MSNNRLYHRQCFRHHERASFVASDSAVDVRDDVTSDGDCSNKAVSVTVSAATATKHRDTPSLISVNKVARASPRTRSPVSAASCLPTLESAVTAAATCDDASVKLPVDQEQVAVNDSAVGSSQVNNAAINVSRQEPSVPAHVQTTSAVSHRHEVIPSQCTSTAVKVTEMETREAASVEVNLPQEELFHKSPYNVENSLGQMESTVNDALGQRQSEQNGVESETTKKTLLITVSASESLSSSSPSSLAAAVTEHVSSSVAKDRVICRPAPSLPKSRPLAPVPEDATAQQPTSPHSSSVNVCQAASLSADTAAVKMPADSVSPSVHSTSDTATNVARTVPASYSSESSCVTVHRAVKDTCRLVAHRPAPLPPSSTQHETKNNQQPTSVVPSDSQRVTVGICRAPATTELSQDVVVADQQETSRHGLQSDVRIAQQSSTGAVSKHCDEPTTLGARRDWPVPTPRRLQLSKLDVQSTDVEMCTDHLSSAEGPMVMTNDAAMAPRSSPVPKPRKKSPAFRESAEVAGKEKPDEVEKHGDIELSHADGSLAVRSKTDDIVVTDFCMFATAGEQPGKHITATQIRLPKIVTAGSSPQPCKENKSLPSLSEEPGKHIPATQQMSSQIATVSALPQPCKESRSPSLSPTLPVKYPRSKKRCAAPPPPRTVSPVSPSMQSLKPEGSSATGSEPQTVGSKEQSLPAVSVSSQADDKSADKSLTVNSEEILKPMRKKISPGVKFTFEKDVFRPGKISATEATSSVELLKPSRPAPPRPAGDAVTKRKVLLARAECIFGYCISRPLFF